ncbi:MAG: sugar transferase [Bacteroidota bacterium]
MTHTCKFICFDLVFMSLAFFVMIYFFPTTNESIIDYYLLPFLVYAVIWLGFSVLFRKYQLERSIEKSLYRIIKSNLVTLAVITMIIFFARLEYSRLLLLGVVVISSFLEVLVTYFYLLNHRITEDSSKIEQFYEERKKLDIPGDKVNGHETIDPELYKMVVNEIGEEAFAFIDSYLNRRYSETLFIATTTRFNILNQPKDKYRNLINLKQLNQVRRINKFFESINDRIPVGGIIADYAETYKLRKQRILRKYPPGLNWIVYTLDFIWKRAFPKLLFLKKIYFMFTAGYNRVLSKAETFGRLYSCGFEIVDEKMIDDQQFFVARKVREPFYDNNPTYGPLIKLRRIGKNGKKIGVYKMRTMHAYSEYLQEYIYNKNRLNDSGKFKDDFRVTTMGKIMRKFWIDEFPMFINVFKGEMKIVGVRPLSNHFFGLYTEELQKLRTETKPGLIPPYYVDLPKSLDEVMESEKKYLLAYKKNPFLTDWKYFWKSMYNIFIKNARSS